MAHGSIAQGASATVALQAGDYIQLNNARGDKGRIETSTAVLVDSHAGTKTYGPFAAGSYTVSSPAGRLRYAYGPTPNMTAPNFAEYSSVAIASKRLGNMLTKGFMGALTTASTGGTHHTTNIQFALEAPFDAVRLIIPNSVTADITGVTARIATSGTAGAAGSSTTWAPSDATWTAAITWGGASSVTLPAGTSADAASWTASDWVTASSIARTDGGALPLLIVRVYIDGSANANRPAWANATLTTWESETSTSGRIIRARTQAVDGVTTLSNFTSGSASNYQCVPVYVQYASRVPGLTFLVVGDSIWEKAGATHRRGWQDLAQVAASTPYAPVEFATASIGGSNSTTWRARLEAVIGKVQPDYVVMPGFEVNDTAEPMVIANIKTMRGNIERARAICMENRAVPILCTGIPSTATGSSGKDWGSSDSFRIALNEERRGLGSAQPVWDFDAALAGSADGDGQIEIATGLSDDGLHPNDAGHASISSKVVAPGVRALITANGL